MAPQDSNTTNAQDVAKRQGRGANKRAARAKPMKTKSARAAKSDELLLTNEEILHEALLQIYGK